MLDTSERIHATTTISMQLAEAAKGDNPAAKLEEILLKLYLSFWDVFSKESFDELPEQKQWEHVIDLKPESQLFSTKVYPMSPIEQKELDDFLKENLLSGRIRPSKSPMASPVFFVKKKDGKLRFVQDYRKLNAVTVKNTYLLPLVPDIINRISDSKAKYFTLEYVGDTTTHESRRGTSGRPLSKQIGASSSPSSCFSASPTARPPSKR